MKLENQIIMRLMKVKSTVALAESCTGGLLAHRLTNISGSSKVLKASLIVYSNESKMKWLKISPKMIKNYGAVSQEVAQAMAQGAQKQCKADVGIGITGIAGPTGGSKMKPVGLTYIAIKSPQTNICERYIFKGRRLVIKQKASTQALRLLQSILNS